MLKLSFEFFFDFCHINFLEEVNGLIQVAVNKFKYLKIHGFQIINQIKTNSMIDIMAKRLSVKSVWNWNGCKDWCSNHIILIIRK